MRDGANDGYVIVSDANGQMNWADPDTLILTGAMNKSTGDTETIPLMMLN